MNWFLFSLYQFFCILFFVFLSSILIYNRLFARWLKVSLGFFMLYTIGSYVLFGVMPLPFNAAQSESFLMALPYMLFFLGTPVLVGFLIFRGFSGKEISGIIVMYCTLIVILIVFSTNLYNKSFGFFYTLEPYTQAYIEIIALLALIIGMPSVIGYCLFAEKSFRASMGTLLLFLSLMGFVFLTIHITTGFEYLSQVKFKFDGTY